MSVKSTRRVSSSKTNWTMLHRKDDKGIDYSDIPKTNAKFWNEAAVVMPCHKIHLSIRFDEDVVGYFKHQGHGYQSRMNAVLRSYVDSQRRRA